MTSMPSLRSVFFLSMITALLRIKPSTSLAFCRSSVIAQKRSVTKLLLNSEMNNEYSTSSWMDKNVELKRYDSMTGQAVSTKTEKQRKRRNQKRRIAFNEKQEQNFKENFLGTRVFVQGIPNYASWQDLKDHFKVAGEVVFASVSIDPETGRSKGCGIVQFESTAMSQNAIKMMRDHPMDGHKLFVREDYQESRGEKQHLNDRQSRGPSPPTTWKCADEENLQLLSGDGPFIVKNLIKARDQARKRKNYDTSDNIREELKTKYGVHLDDRKKLWWVSPDNIVPDTIKELKGNGRWGKQKPWRQIPTTEENDACVDPDLVTGFLKQRDIARREKDFKTADLLLEKARTAPDNGLFLRIHDESRTWRIWTTERPSVPVSHHTAELTAGDQCITIVSKHDPSKVNDVKRLLEKFPGREYNILKKLKQNYGL